MGEPVSLLTAYQGKTLPIDMVEPVKLPIHSYVLRAIDFPTETLPAVPLTNVALELASIISRHG